MLIRSIVSSIIATLAAAIPIFLLTRPTGGNPSMAFPALLGTTFLATFAAAALTTRRQIPGGDARSPSTPDPIRECGEVKWFNTAKGYGFITRDSGDDVFVHFRSIRGTGHRTLKDGQRVEFSVSMAEKGPQADDVTVL